MSLVQYSDSESDADQPAAPPAKRSRRGSSLAGATSKLPPLPAAFHDLYASSTRVSVKDDPSLHGGRKRVIPHVEGNWPTHVYLECTPPCSAPLCPIWFDSSEGALYLTIAGQGTLAGTSSAGLRTS